MNSRPLLQASQALLLVLALLFVAGCSRYWVCDEPNRARQSELPARLTQTGLYADLERGQLAPGVREFRPQFPLWSDGASKRRFIRLPAFAQIDTSDMDSWRFPVGTELWKEFSVGGTRVETRFLRKTGAGDDDWAAMAYVWSADGTDAVAAATGVVDARGTSHDVPSAGECRACHGGRKSFVLGFSAIQLAYTADPGQWDVRALQNEGVITTAPRVSLQVPGNETERAALGYLHANCGHCHNSARPEHAGARCFNPQNRLDFWLRSARLDSVSDTPTFTSGRGLAFEPGDPDNSRMIELTSSRGFLVQMPPLGTEVVDDAGLSKLRGWIALMPQMR